MGMARVGKNNIQFGLHTNSTEKQEASSITNYWYMQGCALAERGGPWCLAFALGRLENLNFFIQIICWAPWISQVHNSGLPSIFLRAQPCVLLIIILHDTFFSLFSHVLPMLSFFQTRSVKQTTVFRGPLEIGSQLKINVYGYIRVCCSLLRLHA